MHGDHFVEEKNPQRKQEGMATKGGKKQEKLQVPGIKDRKYLPRQTIQKNQIRDWVLVNVSTRGRSQSELWKHTRDISMGLVLLQDSRSVLCFSPSAPIICSCSVTQLRPLHTLKVEKEREHGVECNSQFCDQSHTLPIGSQSWLLTGTPQ